ncbi:hypothetical protein [Neorhodopirellula lusitana]|uniref:hypothetical protein n=1 Tax=Neorhodopirellula lusitana TaxID=445327 RepID=UPI0024B7916B|nr:hypothetical protein [Neorhodopirellula lusitana]
MHHIVRRVSLFDSLDSTVRDGKSDVGSNVAKVPMAIPGWNWLTGSIKHRDVS